jgi:hypothetical protein
MARLPPASCMAFVCCIARCTVIAACMPCGVPCGTSSAAPPRQVRAACRATIVLLPPRCMYAVRPLYVCCMPVVCMRCACMYVVCPLYVCGAPAAPLRLRVVRVLGPLHVHGRGVRLDAEGPLAVLHSLLQQPSPGADVAAASPVPEQMRAGLSLPCHDLWFVQSEQCSRAARNATCRIEHGTRAQRPGTPAAFVSRMPRREQAHT